MTHLTEQDLLDSYYGEPIDPRNAQHLRTCDPCQNSFAALGMDLDQAALDKSPARFQRFESYGEKVWESLRPSLTSFAPPKRPWFPRNLRPALRFAAASVALLLLAFFAGRHWEKHHTLQVNNIKPGAGDPRSRERVIIFVLGDHLDRSEQLLVELAHPETAAADTQLQATARRLLTENRLYRQSANDPSNVGSSGDLSLDSTLEDLEQVLAEVANNPNGLSRSEIHQIQREMNTGTLLFEVRVLRSRIQQQINGPYNGKGGTA